MSVESIAAKLEKVLSASRAMYIIDSTGILLHHEFFMNQQEDPDLNSGLFAAVNVYSKELQAGNINAINLEDHKFLFKEHKETKYLIVLDVFKDVTDIDGMWLLDQILDRFKAMQTLMKEDYKGSVTLVTLFDERGKTINWSTIHQIREDAVEKQKSLFDHVDTLNLTKINLNNRLWVKIRKIISTMVENQKGLTGMFLYIMNQNEKNVLYSGRNREQLDELQQYLENRTRMGIGLELEMERIKLGDEYTSIYPILIGEGGLLAISSNDKYLITRLNNQMERLVASIEKLRT
jgi:hypothetical protein